MEEWKSKLKQLGNELKPQDIIQQFPEDSVDSVLRIAIGSTYKPQNGEVVTQVVRNHHEPYVVRTVAEGLLLYAKPGNIRGILPGDFVAIRKTGYTVQRITRVYK